MTFWKWAKPGCVLNWSICGERARERLYHSSTVWNIPVEYERLYISFWNIRFCSLFWHQCFWLDLTPILCINKLLQESDGVSFFFFKLKKSLWTPCHVGFSLFLYLFCLFFGGPLGSHYGNSWRRLREMSPLFKRWTWEQPCGVTLCREGQTSSEETIRSKNIFKEEGCFKLGLHWLRDVMAKHIFPVVSATTPENLLYMVMPPTEALEGLSAVL